MVKNPVMPRLIVHPEEVDYQLKKAAGRLGRWYDVIIRQPNPSFTRSGPQYFEYRFLIGLGGDLRLMVSSHDLSFRIWAVRIALVTADNASPAANKPEHIIVLGELDEKDACPKCLNTCDGETCPVEVSSVAILSEPRSLGDEIVAWVRLYMGDEYRRAVVTAVST
jgi:hypothetical protein